VFGRKGKLSFFLYPSNCVTFASYSAHSKGLHHDLESISFSSSLLPIKPFLYLASWMHGDTNKLNYFFICFLLGQIITNSLACVSYLIISSKKFSKHVVCLFRCVRKCSWIVIWYAYIHIHILYTPCELFALDPGVYSASNRNEYQKKERMFLRSKARPVRTADNLTAICEQTVYTILDPQHLTTLFASTACYA
jgi:hypothetical protein